MQKIIAALALVCLGLFTTVASADDWTADQLRGQVLQLIDNKWQPLLRGGVVPDNRVIRTLAMGRVTLTRGNETVDIGPDTQIQIYDRGGRKPFTTVKQYFGSVSVEAEVRQVQHFAVETPYLAAVVKGTRFTVRSGRTGASVSVRRGHVAVEDKHDKTHVMLSVGQSASVGVANDTALEVSGGGQLPVVLDAKGKPVVGGNSEDRKAAEKADKQAEKDAKDALKAAKKAEKDAAKAEKDAEKAANDNSGSSGSDSSGSSSGSGSSGSGSGSSGSGHSGSGKGKGKD